MDSRPRTGATSGYSLVELLVVLAIVGILAIVGVTMLGSRQSGAVRGLLDELEGSLTNARQASVATGRDVAIVTWGSWDAATPLSLAHGDSTLTDLNIQTTANNLALGVPPDVALGTNGQTVAIPFRYKPNDAMHQQARIVAIGSAQWTNVMLATSAGATNEDLTKVEPFKSGPMKDLVVDTNNLFQAGTSRSVVSGTNKRFSSTFIIPVVGTSSSGGALPGGPMGMIVVLANGGSIFKFYNPGARDSDGKWRRL